MPGVGSVSISGVAQGALQGLLSKSDGQDGKGWRQWEAGLPCRPHTQCRPGEGPAWSYRRRRLPPGTTAQRTSDAVNKERNMTAKNSAHRSELWSRGGGGQGTPTLDLGFEKGVEEERSGMWMSQQQQNRCIISAGSLSSTKFCAFTPGRACLPGRPSSRSCISFSGAWRCLTQ